MVGRSAPRSPFRPAITPVAALSAVAPGLAAAILLSLASDHAWRFLALSVVVSMAAAAGGALIGFLFGIPRTVAGSTPHRLPYSANTNLEQVSDWLTKILIGVGLTQLGEIGRAAGRLVGALGPVFSPGAYGRTYGAGLILYFLIVGFFAGWLPTRMHLGPALSRSDRQALDLLQAAQVAEDAGDESSAERLRATALRLSEDVARRYESLRTEAPDTRRTAAMESAIETARRIAQATRLEPDEVRAIFEAGTEGDRIRALGLMQGDARLADFDAACDAIENSRSAFEQLQGLSLMEDLASDLSRAQAERLRAALDAQTGPTGHIHEHSHRWGVAQRVRRLAALPADTGAAR